MSTREKAVTHTPGPWATESTQKNLISVCTDSLVVADCWSDDYECEVSETDWANARLIAAAPELLEILETVLVWEMDYRLRNNLGNIGPDWVERGLAAIRKAKGEAL